VSDAIRVVLADDHPVVLEGLRNLVGAEKDFELLGEAATGTSALDLIRATLPDVAVLDVSMPGLNGISVTQRVSQEFSNVRVLLLTFHEDRAYLNQALRSGARGYVLKRTAAKSLITAIRAVYDGGLYVDPALVELVLEGGRSGSPKLAGLIEAPTLSDRETEVLKLAALGFTNREIARRLEIGIKTVETHKARGADKLGLKSRSEIVRYALAQGWLTED
jgi:DNA-binding NarL/FixJ family response regulator